MPLQAPGGAFVVVGRHQQQGIGTRFLRGAAKRLGTGGIIAACPRDDRHSTVYRFDNRFDHGIVLLGGQGRGFSRGTAGNQRRDTALHLPFGQCRQHGKVKRPVLPHGGDQRRSRPVKQYLFHVKHSSFHMKYM